MFAATDSDFPLQKAQLFGSFDDFMLALDDWPVQAKFNHVQRKAVSPLALSKVCAWSIQC